MEKHLVQVMLTVQVDAFGKSDALEAVQDAFGEGDCGGVEVVGLEIIDYSRVE